MQTHPTIRTALTAVALAVAAQAASATDFTLLSDASLIGRLPGADGYWNSADDIVFSGLNPFGAATAFGDQTGNYGTTTGTFGINDGDPARFGVNTLTSGSFALEVSNNTFGFFNVPVSSMFDASLPSTSTIAADRSAIATYHMVDEFGQTSSFAGSYLWLLPGDNPADYVSDADFLAHVDFLLALLPAGWTTFVTGLETYTVTNGASAGALGTLSKAYYSLDPNAAPVPVPAALPLLLGGLAGLGACRRRAAAA